MKIKNVIPNPDNQRKLNPDDINQSNKHDTALLNSSFYYYSITHSTVRLKIWMADKQFKENYTSETRKSRVIIGTTRIIERLPCVKSPLPHKIMHFSYHTLYELFRLLQSHFNSFFWIGSFVAASTLKGNWYECSPLTFSTYIIDIIWHMCYIS